MDKLIIEGGIQLDGDIPISGAKNAALPILMASILATQPVTIANIPHLQDITTSLGLLVQLGLKIMVDEKMKIVIDSNQLHAYEAPYELVKKIACLYFSLRAIAHPVWPSKSISARRMCYRLASCQSTFKSIRNHGCGDLR